MSQFKDFEGEFLPVKHYRPEELLSDQFIARLKLEKRLKTGRPPITNEKQDLPIDVPRRRPRIKILGIEEFKESLEARKTQLPQPLSKDVPKRRKLPTLVGIEQFQKMIEAKHERTAKKRKISLAGTSEFRSLIEQRDRLKDLKLKLVTKATRIEADADPNTESSLYDYTGFQDSTSNRKVQSHETFNFGLNEMPPSSNSMSHTILGLDQKEHDSYDEKKAREDELTYDKSRDNSFREHEGERKLSNSITEASNPITNSEKGASKECDETLLSTDDQEENKNSQANYADEDVSLMRRIIMSQLTGKTFPQIEKSLLHGPYEQVCHILEHTVRDHEGHSILLIGPRGSGKTLILNKAIDSLTSKYSDLFIVIKLNASLHSDDRIALREIARQLDSNSNKFGNSSVETTTFEQRAISDTFTNILLTLDSNAPGRKYDDENEDPTPVIIIIDEIEKFTSNAKQTLLYNIFDLSQSSKIPIAVIGVTSMITTRELLERRVRSRFSQRIIDITRPNSMEQFWHNAKLNLTVSPECFSQFQNQDYPEQWNNHIELLNNTPGCLKKIIYKIFFTTKNYQDLNNCGLLPVKKISNAQPFPQDTDFEAYMQGMAPNYVQAAIAALSNLELLLVISAARWIERVDVPHVNFNLAYQEYTEMMKTFNREATTLSSSASYIDNTVLASIKVSQKIWSPKVLRDCWANLYKMGLLFDVITTNNEVNANNNYNMYKEMVIEDSKMLQLDVSLDDLGSLIDSSLSFKKLTRL